MKSFFYLITTISLFTIFTPATLCMDIIDPNLSTTEKLIQFYKNVHKKTLTQKNAIFYGQIHFGIKKATPFQTIISQKNNQKSEELKKLAEQFEINLPELLKNSKKAEKREESSDYNGINLLIHAVEYVEAETKNKKKPKRKKRKSRKRRRDDDAYDDDDDDYKSFYLMRTRDKHNLRPRRKKIKTE